MLSVFNKNILMNARCSGLGQFDYWCFKCDHESRAVFTEVYYKRRCSYWNNLHQK